ncbi:chromosome segregation protein SMC [Salinimonas lutimaris]|uniref:chromosome segregation protein SMC n=1 Tax=Salinimonas lutimaris TaxID=914153 RepID=UPI0010BFF8EB|nr:chromosome segregation protein SMC [Salinimonas lutimaris]
MRLKKIKLAGFKSFVDPTTIPFVGEMTAIVGPNGCGKSNVIDAVRWVLGESSAKNLRGDAMTDVIFNGSSARKPVGQCSVELIFDNSAGRIDGEYASFNELSVRRVVTREGQSHYALNGTKCRRKDVTDLFLGTGLGPRSYAIIEQGMISRLIESKPQELRVFLEEAAGVSKYKERRRETENRIRHTRDNLERLEDVRGELGRQLEKLQRQASAAQRYRELKSAERRLKGELAALRWQKQNTQMVALQKKQQASQHELNTLEDQQRGGEAGLQTYRQQADDARAALDSLQQQKFTLSTSITRIEQQALHGRQRATQITAELNEIAQQQQQLRDAADAARGKVTALTDTKEEQAPRLALLNEQVAQNEVQLEEAEEVLRAFGATDRQHSERHQQAAQQAQSHRVQLQSVQDMQTRTRQRISEIEQELGGQDDKTLAAEQQALTLALEQASEKVASLTDSLSEATGHQAQINQQAGEQQALVDAEREKLQQARASHSALISLQQAAATDLTDYPGLQPAWQRMQFAADWQQAAQTVLSFLHHPLISDDEDAPEVPGYLVWSALAHTDEPVDGSLAAQADAGSFVPALFNQILIASDESLARALQQSSQGRFWIVTPQGQLFGHNWHYVPGEQDPQHNLLRQASMIEQLEQDIARLEETVAQGIELAEQTRQQQSDANQAVRQLDRQLQQTRLEAQGIEQQLEACATRHAQLQARTTKLQDELSRYQVLNEQESAQITTLIHQLEEAQQQQDELAGVVEDSHRQREILEQAVVAARHSLNQRQSEHHQLQLRASETTSQLSAARDQVTRHLDRLSELDSRREKLAREQADILQPQTQQQAQLDELLSQREAVEASLQSHRQHMEKVDALITEAQKGHNSLTATIASRQAEIDRMTIEIESIRARANTVVEQLAESQQNLNTLLESLPDEADEKRWQQELEQTQAAITRLGAVNLAAVEEYDAQAERKTHLDIQYEDLTTALETLQSAIRKIDKETKSRFAETFDQVNADLKALFPKVFGGGSAYLDLTDDDLLETGVTIMARPPGKKNSTIHLLSGGEKALTALSLVFAIFRLNPAPFCLLDEVDAPLDDANVGRFCNLVSQMSEQVQFIYITHNKIAMEMATHLTGVTMAEPGVSRMVAVDVDEAMAFVEA